MWSVGDAGQFPVEWKHLVSRLISIQLNGTNMAHFLSQISACLWISKWSVETEHPVLLGVTKWLLSDWTCDCVEEVTKYSAHFYTSNARSLPIYYQADHVISFLFAAALGIQLQHPAVFYHNTRHYRDTESSISAFILSVYFLSTSDTPKVSAGFSCPLLLCVSRKCNPPTGSTIRGGTCE